MAIELTPEEIASAKGERRAELERTFSREGYAVIRKELFAHQRDPAMTIRNRSITFNTACINGLEDVVWIKFWINEELKRIAILPCDENDKDAVRWCVAKPDKRRSRNITCPDLTDMLFDLMKWDKAYRYKMLGYRIQPDGETMYIFDLLVWERTKNGGKRKKEVIDIEEALVSEGETNAPAEAATVVETVVELESKFPEEVSGSFGVSVEQHERETEVRELDGYVTAAMLTGAISDETTPAEAEDPENQVVVDLEVEETTVGSFRESRS